MNILNRKVNFGDGSILLYPHDCSVDFERWICIFYF